MAVLVVTVVRFIFLSFPLRWREILTYRNQMLGFLCAFLVAHFLGFLPLMQICEITKFTMRSNVCVIEKSWSIRCVMCFLLSLGCGLVLPKVAVTVMYCLIYRIIKRARESKKALSTNSMSLSSKSDAESTRRKSYDKEKKMNKERESFPWSLVVVLLLNVTSAIPWVTLVGAPELFYQQEHTAAKVVIDVLYSILLLAMTSSPIAYLLTTRVVRDSLLSSVRRCFSL